MTKEEAIQLLVEKRCKGRKCPKVFKTLPKSKCKFCSTYCAELSGQKRKPNRPRQKPWQSLEKEQEKGIIGTYLPQEYVNRISTFDPDTHWV